MTNKAVVNVGTEGHVDHDKPRGIGESALNDLLCCPICGADAAWCDEHNEIHEGINECHLIVCTGKCGAEFDMSKGDNSEALEVLKSNCLLKFNTRPSLIET